MSSTQPAGRLAKSRRDPLHGVVESAVPDDCGLLAAVVFPAQRALLAPRPAGHLQCTALLRLTDGTVWMLTLPGRGWTQRRVTAAADILAACSATSCRLREVEARLRGALAVESVAVMTPALAPSGMDAWRVDEVARALAWREDVRAAFRNVEPALETALRTRIETAVAAFVAGLDPEARALATCEGRLDPDIYNYLAYAPHAAYRRQFAVTFPALLRGAVTAEPGSLGSELRSLVDTGTPVIKGLATRWGVSRRAIRHLVGTPLPEHGAAWAVNGEVLARVIDALHPADYPGEEAASWELLDRALGVARTLFRKQAWHSFAALEWLRECVRQVRKGSPRVRDCWLPDRETMRLVHGFRDALDVVAQGRMQVAPGIDAGFAGAMAEMAVDRFMLAQARAGLGEIATKFHSHLARLRESVTRLRSGRRLWPLLPAERVSDDGSRTIRSLVTYDELQQQGTALANCLGGGSAELFIQAAAWGHRFVVGVFERGTGEPRSTAEFAVHVYSDTHSYDVVLVQHTAHANAEPSIACRLAIAELEQDCRSPEVRRHLEAGWKMLRKLREESRTEHSARSAALLGDALRLTLGDENYEMLLSELPGRT